MPAARRTSSSKPIDIKETSVSANPSPISVGTYARYVLIFLAGLIIGYLYNRVTMLETNNQAGNPTVKGVQEVNTNPTAAPKADLKVDESDPTKGNKNAKVVVYTFEDFQCPFCGAFAGLNKTLISSMQQRDSSWQPALPNLIKDYVDTGKVLLVWKDYPFLGDESRYAHMAARCAQDQGKFWEYYEKLFSSQEGENQGKFSKDNLKKFAVELGLNTSAFNTCMDSDKYAGKMQEAVTYGQGVGVNGTPATFINGRLVSGAVPYSQFKTIIEEELKKP